MANGFSGQLRRPPSAEPVERPILRPAQARPAVIASLRRSTGCAHSQGEKCAFFVLTGPGWAYIEGSGKTYGGFMGEAVHANARGCQVIGWKWRARPTG